jgi:hypothetical protein
VSLANLKPQTVLSLRVVETVSETFGFGVALTSVADGHPLGRGSYHPWGLAVDWQLFKWQTAETDGPVLSVPKYFKPNDLNQAQRTLYLKALFQALPIEFEVIEEAARAHWHGEVEIKRRYV